MAVSCTLQPTEDTYYVLNYHVSENEINMTCFGFQHFEWSNSPNKALKFGVLIKYFAWRLWNSCESRSQLIENFADNLRENDVKIEFHSHGMDSTYLRLNMHQALRAILNLKFEFLSIANLTKVGDGCALAGRRPDSCPAGIGWVRPPALVASGNCDNCASFGCRLVPASLMSWFIN